MSWPVHSLKLPASNSLAKVATYTAAACYRAFAITHRKSWTTSGLNKCQFFVVDTRWQIDWRQKMRAGTERYHHNITCNPLVCSWFSAVKVRTWAVLQTWSTGPSQIRLTCLCWRGGYLQWVNTVPQAEHKWSKMTNLRS